MPNQYVDYCPQGHPTPTSAHRTKSGVCKACEADRSRQVRRKQSAVLAVVKELEGRGVSFTAPDGGPASAKDVLRQLIDLGTAIEP